jgi:hypothetical protein
MIVLLLALACRTTSTIELGGEDTGSPPDSGSDPDTAERLPDPDPEEELGRPVIEPPGGGFVERQEVALRVEDGEGDLEYCLADPEENGCRYAAYTGPIEITGSTIVHARVVSGEEVSKPVAHSFVQLSAGLAGSFSSNLPVLLFWSAAGAPNSSNDVPLGLTVLTPGDGATGTLLDPPESSGRARMHVRGSSSAGFDKHAWDLELWDADAATDRNEALTGLPADGDWVLYAPYYFDEALIRNPLAYAISREVGRYAPRTRMVEVFVAEWGQSLGSNAYVGVYVLTEEIERGADRVAITEILPEDVAEPEVTGGYLFKVDRLADGERGFSAGTARGTWEFQQTFAWVDPSEATVARAQQAWLKDELDSIGNALVEDDFIDPATGRRYDEILDVDSFIDHHIINLVMKNPDALRLSAYMYKDRGALLQAGPVWDFDRAAISTDSRSFDPTWWDNQNETTDCTDMWEFGWYPGLFEDPLFADRYWTRFAALLDGELSAGNLDALILTLADGLDDAAARNQNRWGGAEFRGEVDELRDWMAVRHAWMRDCIDRYEDPRVCPGD